MKGEEIIPVQSSRKLHPVVFGKGGMLSSSSFTEEGLGSQGDVGHRARLWGPAGASVTVTHSFGCHHNVQQLPPARREGKKAKLEGAWNTLEDVPARGRMSFKSLQHKPFYSSSQISSLLSSPAKQSFGAPTGCEQRAQFSSPPIPLCPTEDIWVTVPKTPPW